jgi:hypothetical protein
VRKLTTGVALPLLGSRLWSRSARSLYMLKPFWFLCRGIAPWQYQSVPFSFIILGSCVGEELLRGGYTEQLGDYYVLFIFCSRMPHSGHVETDPEVRNHPAFRTPNSSLSFPFLRLSSVHSGRFGLLCLFFSLPGLRRSILGSGRVNLVPRLVLLF